MNEQIYIFIRSLFTIGTQHSKAQHMKVCKDLLLHQSDCAHMSGNLTGKMEVVGAGGAASAGKAGEEGMGPGQPERPRSATGAMRGTAQGLLSGSQTQH